MKYVAVPLVLATTVMTSACAYYGDGAIEILTVPTEGRTVSSVSQDAGLSLAAGAAPGTVSGYFYDWDRRFIEQEIQAAQRRERILQRQAGAAP
jgi:hypothetical protein